MKKELNNTNVVNLNITEQLNISYKLYGLQIFQKRELQMTNKMDQQEKFLRYAQIGSKLYTEGTTDYRFTLIGNSDIIKLNKREWLMRMPSFLPVRAPTK